MAFTKNFLFNKFLILLSMSSYFEKIINDFAGKWNNDFAGKRNNDFAGKRTIDFTGKSIIIDFAGKINFDLAGKSWNIDLVGFWNFDLGRNLQLWRGLENKTIAIIILVSGHATRAVIPNRQSTWCTEI